jgi:hypothetical protein
VRITFSDERETAAIGFDVRVVASGNVSTTVSWQPPTRNEGGSVLTNLAGYCTYYGTTLGEYTNSIKINNPGITTYVLENLVPGT